jgi:hypothetical protein
MNVGVSPAPPHSVGGSRNWLVIGGIVALALALRLYQLGSENRPYALNISPLKHGRR